MLGQLTNTYNLRDVHTYNATSLIDPEHFRFLEIGSTTYVYGAGGDNSADDGISVFRLEMDGSLTLVQTFFDN